MNTNKIIFLNLCALIAAIEAEAQFLDSLKITAGIQLTMAQKEYQPHWLISNKFGSISDQKYDASTYAGLRNIHYFNRSKSINSDSLSSPANPAGTYLGYGLNVVSNNHFKDFILQEGYVKAGYNNFEVRFGRILEVPGEVDQDLSSGSLGISGNALPIPKVGIALTKYSNVPFTNGWLQIKGQLSHGWFGNNRYMKDAFYHEKNLYVRVGKNRFKFFVGMQHYGEWAGRRGNLQLERSWKGFWDVFLAKTANDGSVNPAFDPNRAGDQRGLLEFGFDYESKNLLFHFYNQSPFESGIGINIKNIDRLAGLSVAPKNGTSSIKKILLEFIYTKQMEGYTVPSKRQTYYNNGYYRTGWEYENRVIGSPLFINRTVGQHYFDNIKPFGWNTDTTQGNVNIIFMQMIGGNLGGIYALGKHFIAKTFITYISGIYRGKNKSQVYAMQEVSYQSSKNLLLTIGVGFDTGDLTKNSGLSAGIHWEFKAK